MRNKELGFQMRENNIKSNPVDHTKNFRTGGQKWIKYKSIRDFIQPPKKKVISF